jgi:hypothetical protein
MSFYLLLSSGVDLYSFRLLCHLAFCIASRQNIITLSLFLHAALAYEVCIHFIETFLCVHKVQFTLEHAMRAHKGSRGMAVLFFKTRLYEVGGERHTRPLYLQGEGLGTHSIGGWMGSRTGLDGCGKSRSYRDSITVPSSPNEALYRPHYPGPYFLRVFFHGTTASSEPGPHYRGLTITLRHTTLGRTPLNE